MSATCPPSRPPSHHFGREPGHVGFPGKSTSTILTVERLKYQSAAASPTETPPMVTVESKPLWQCMEGHALSQAPCADHGASTMGATAFLKSERWPAMIAFCVALHLANVAAVSPLMEG